MVAIRDGDILHIRAGGEPHRFIGIWVVVVEGRAFVRSWSLKPRSWYRTFLKEPRGTIQVAVRLSAGVAVGMVFLPFHWGDLFAPENAANYLTISAIGRVAKQPELKFCAVNVEKVLARSAMGKHDISTRWDAGERQHAAET